MKKSIFLSLLLFPFLAVGQISGEELSSPSTIALIAELIQDENKVHGNLERINGSWSIKAETEATNVLNDSSDKIYSDWNKSLQAGIKEWIAHLIKENSDCYKYIFEQKDGIYLFHLYECE